MDPLSALLCAVFVASLAGSLHCAGMCGGFVAFYSGTGGGGRVTRHLAYNGGRLATYVVLGALCGALGAAVDLAGSMAGIQRIAAVAAGILMIVWGGYSLAQVLDVRLPALPAPRWLVRVSSRLLGSLRERPPVLRGLSLGLFSTLLPCGWLWAFALLAAGTGSPLRGALVMGAFWAGTVPVLLGFGVSLQWLSAPLRRRVPALSAVLLIVIGLAWLVGRVTLPTHAGLHGAASPVAGAPASHPEDHSGGGHP